MTSTTLPTADSKQMGRVHAGRRVGIVYGRNWIDRTKRTLFGSNGCNVYGWASGGGVIIRSAADVIEMQCLGLDRLEPQEKRFKDQDDEDAFCLRLLNMGGKWWPSERRANLVWSELNSMVSGIEDETDEEMRELWVGCPESGGVLVSEFQSTIGEIKIPDDIGMLKMALTTEERCELLRTRFGAVYYERPQEYAGFSNQYAVLSRDRSAS